MTTQQTFQELVDRVGVATEKLETAVTAVELGTGEITVLVERAEQAEAGAIAASEIANDAADAAIAAKNTILNTPILPEAPQDGKTYGRSNAAWVEVTGGGGGTGTVQSVNEVEPDAEGNITLTPADIGAANAVHTHTNATQTEAGFMSANDKTKLDGVATGANVGITSIQAGSNITIDNTNPLSPIISATGGGSSGGFPITEELYYNEEIITEWPSTNPNEAIDLNLCGAWLKGRWKAGGELLLQEAGLNILPSGTYFFSSIDDYVENIAGAGVVLVTNSSATDKTVRVITYGNATTLPQEYFPVIASNEDVTWRLKTDNPKFLFPQFENGWEYNFGTSGSPNWQPVDYWPVDSNHAVSMLSFRRRGSPYAGASSSLPSTGQDGLPISWNQMFSSAGYIQYVPPGKYWFTTSSFANSTGGAALYNKTGYITVYGSAGGAGTKRAEAIAFDTTTNIPSVYYWKSDGTWNKAT